MEADDKKCKIAGEQNKLKKNKWQRCCMHGRGKKKEEGSLLWTTEEYYLIGNASVQGVEEKMHGCGSPVN